MKNIINEIIFSIEKPFELKIKKIIEYIKNRNNINLFDEDNNNDFRIWILFDWTLYFENAIEKYIENTNYPNVLYLDNSCDHLHYIFKIYMNPNIYDRYNNKFIWESINSLEEDLHLYHWVRDENNEKGIIKYWLLPFWAWCVFTVDDIKYAEHHAFYNNKKVIDIILRKGTKYINLDKMWYLIAWNREDYYKYLYYLSHNKIWCIRWNREDTQYLIYNPAYIEYSKLNINHCFLWKVIWKYSKYFEKKELFRNFKIYSKIVEKNILLMNYVNSCNFKK